MRYLPFKGYQYLAIFIGLAIIAAALTTFYYYQSLQYEKIRATLIEQQRLRQIDSTYALAEHIGSSLDSIVTRLEVVAKSSYAEEADFSNQKLLALAEEQKESINAIASIDFMFINDQDGVRRIHLVPEGTQPYAGFDFSARDYMEEAKTSLAPVFSDGYVGTDAQYRIALAYPIINKINGEYQGVVAVSVPAVKFFEQFANTRDSTNEYAVVFDGEANILAIPSVELVDKNFFADDVQTLLTEDNEKEIQDFVNLFDKAQSSVSVDDFGQEHRITTREPVLIRDNPEYFIIVSTSSNLLYSDINPLLEGESLQGLSMLLVASAGVGTLIFFLARWNSSLNVQVVKRTKQLNESNRMLQDANEKLRKSDQLQKEFINVAAHELRTPIQPLLGIAEMLDSQFEASDSTENRVEGNEQPEIKVTRPEVEIIIRNAKRLERLSSDILEVARIESQSLRLSTEEFDINKLASDAIDDIKIALSLSPTPRKIRISLQTSESVIEVKADKARLFEVISNLLRNAAKFTANERSITVVVRKVRFNELECDNNLNESSESIGVQLSVTDTGSGIDPEILPRMFSKFTTKSESGTGLGLYISKSIIEAHTGRIWAENNENGIGAKVTFVIPTGIKSVEQQSSH